MFWSIAYAQAEAAAKQPSFLEQMFPIIVIFVVFWLFMIRPQAKKYKKQQEFQKALKRGDEVVTFGGIFGKVEGINDSFVTLEVDSGVKLKVLRQQVANFVKERQP